MQQELLHWQALFSDFYGKHYSSYRQLVWQHSLSTAMLRAQFPKGAKELSVSLTQVCVCVCVCCVAVERRHAGSCLLVGACLACKLCFCRKRVGVQVCKRMLHMCGFHDGGLVAGAVAAPH
jgi:hypothetical protein